MENFKNTSLSTETPNNWYHSDRTKSKKTWYLQTTSKQKEIRNICKVQMISMFPVKVNLILQ